ncbi:MAG: fatty acid desaturase, partial [Planctomycetes bacterium]|nr:fatty acid desaturase [Planctomycetota bacterium]
DPARMPLWKVLLWGPVFLLRLWLWAFRRRRNNTKERVWLVAEAAWGILVIATSLVLLPITPWVAAYVLMALVGSWVYPLLTVHLPHRNYGETPLTQTHTLRGRIIPSLFLELTYHLEHHLYPEVPAHNLRRLSTRMDPYFAANRVRPIKVP